jgi:hypothetical protein
MEREERTLSLIERDVGEREARVASREKMLAEREAKVISVWDVITSFPPLASTSSSTDWL